MPPPPCGTGGTRLFPSTFSLWTRTRLVPNATAAVGASPGQPRARPWSPQSLGPLRVGAGRGPSEVPSLARGQPRTPSAVSRTRRSPQRGDALLASYESLIYALLSKEQTKLCRNSPRRALMQDWISGEEG